MSAIVLRDYQEAAIEAARAELRRGVKRLIVSAPTGAGKTEIAMALIQAAADKGSRVSFIADRRSLVGQTSQRFSDAGIQHGVLMGDETVGTMEPVRVESAQTIQSRGLRMGTHLFALDEGHEIRPELIRQIAEAGAILVMFTATPFPAALAEPIDAHLPAEKRADDAPPRYEAMVSTVTTDRLIADGHLCPFDVVAPVAVVDTSGVKVQGGEFQKAELKDRIMRIVGEIVPTWRRHSLTSGTAARFSRPSSSGRRWTTRRPSSGSFARRAFRRGWSPAGKMTTTTGASLKRSATASSRCWSTARC